MAWVLASSNEGALVFSEEVAGTPTKTLNWPGDIPGLTNSVKLVATTETIIDAADSAVVHVRARYAPR